MANLALFDFDHTITTNDNFTSFIYYGVPVVRRTLGSIVLAPLLVVKLVRVKWPSADLY